MHGLLIEGSAHEFHRDAELHGLAAKCLETDIGNSITQMTLP